MIEINFIPLKQEWTFVGKRHQIVNVRERSGIIEHLVIIYHPNDGIKQTNIWLTTFMVEKMQPIINNNN